MQAEVTNNITATDLATFTQCNGGQAVDDGPCQYNPTTGKGCKELSARLKLMHATQAAIQAVCLRQMKTKPPGMKVHLVEPFRQVAHEHTLQTKMNQTSKVGLSSVCAKRLLPRVGTQIHQSGCHHPYHQASEHFAPSHCNPAPWAWQFARDKQVHTGNTSTLFRAAVASSEAHGELYDQSDQCPGSGTPEGVTCCMTKNGLFRTIHAWRPA